MKLIDIRKEVIESLKKAKIAEPVLDCDVIIAHVLQLERHEIITDKHRLLNSNELGLIRKMIQRRIKYEPVAYLLNKKEFYSLDLYVNENVLIPRPETELLVDLVLYHAPQNGEILDLCTGSGAIAIAVKHNRKDLQVKASDISKEALHVAVKNSNRLLGAEEILFSHSDLFHTYKDRQFDIIVSNPPYVNREIADNLQKELQYEPESALYAGDKGYEIIHKIIDQAGEYLTPSGILILEIGSEMGEDIVHFAENHGFSGSIYRDYSQLSRAVLMKKGIRHSNL